MFGFQQHSACCCRFLRPSGASWGGERGREAEGDEQSGKLHDFTGNCSGVYWLLFIEPSQASPQLHMLFVEGGRGGGLLNIITAAGSKWHWSLFKWIWIISATESVFCLSLLCSEPNWEHTFGHKEIYFNECGLLRNVNSRSRQPSAINTETVCLYAPKAIHSVCKCMIQNNFIVHHCECFFYDHTCH